MKTAIVGSRGLHVQDLSVYLPEETTEIVSGGAKGIDTCAAGLAEEKGYKLTVFLPDYRRYGRGAPLKRNEKIVGYADFVVILWDGCSRGTGNVLALCQRTGKPYLLRIIKPA